MVQTDFILVLDFGSQYTQLIARRIRELGVYSEIRRFDISEDEVASLRPKGIILSGGPASVFQKGAPIIERGILALHIPLLGICYGLQLLALLGDGDVTKATHREYGHAELQIEKEDQLFAGLGDTLKVWMSHGDRLSKIPEGFEAIARTVNSPIAAVRNSTKKIYGLQFHPEVVHTERGGDILANFIFKVCACEGSWSPESFITGTIDAIREKVGSKRVLCALSGGVDSSVAALLVERAVGAQLLCVFVDTGLLRQGEAEEVCRTFEKDFAFEFRFVNAAGRFLKKLKGVTDPEEKRKVIGVEFIRIFEEEARRAGDIEYLVQGTLYPDVIESVSVRGPSATIKTHHNVGGLPEKMGLALIEPLRELFKDEVRKVGAELGLPANLLNRHPFPGPGLAVRIMGEVNSEYLSILRQADHILLAELHNSGWYHKVWQAFCVFLPVKSVGVMGDERTYESVAAIRAVTSEDGMTADWAHLPAELLARISTRISNEVTGVNRVVYDISSKPPSTIEWE